MNSNNLFAIEGHVDFKIITARWAWQSTPVLQLPPVQIGGVVSLVGSPNEESSKPRSLVSRVESRVVQVKEDNGVENALRAAEEILRQRRRWEDLTIGRILLFYSVVVYHKQAAS